MFFSNFSLRMEKRVLSCKERKQNERRRKLGKMSEDENRVRIKRSRIAIRDLFSNSSDWNIFLNYKIAIDKLLM